MLTNTLVFLLGSRGRTTQETLLPFFFSIFYKARIMQFLLHVLFWPCTRLRLRLLLPSHNCTKHITSVLCITNRELSLQCVGKNLEQISKEGQRQKDPQSFKVEKMHFEEADNAFLQPCKILEPPTAF